MLQTITFDTQQVFEILAARGYTPEQAKGFVEAIKELNLDQLVTKNDLTLQIEKLKLEILIKVGGMLFLLGGYLTAIKFFGH